jgi:glycosyltransferase involved in cell wall biosynthesis
MARLALLLPDLGAGGAERVALNLAHGLARAGHEVDLVLAQARGELLPHVGPAVRLVDLRAPRLRGVLWPLARYLRREQPAALLACMWPLTVMALCARRLAAVPTRVVVAEHATWSRSPLVQGVPPPWRDGPCGAWLHQRLVAWQVRSSMRRLFPRAEGIVAVSHGAARDLCRFAGLDERGISVIYNPVVDEAAGAGAPPGGPSTRPGCGPQTGPEIVLEGGLEDRLQGGPLGRAVADWLDGPHRVLAVGSLKAEKDYGTLIRAFALLRRQLDARLLILGEGPCRAALEALVLQLGLQGQVLLPGFAPQPAPCYRAAGVLALSSVTEALPTVLIEALAQGTPVVSTDCVAGPGEILDGGRFGRLVPVGDAAALARALHAALLQHHDREALRARARVFSIDQAVDRYEALLCGASPRREAA